MGEGANRVTTVMEHGFRMGAAAGTASGPLLSTKKPAGAAPGLASSTPDGGGGMSLAEEIGEEPAAALRRSIGGPLYRAFIAEQDRWRLWSAVFFATGCGSYFGMVEEPPVWLGAVLTLGALGLGIVLRSRLPWVALALFACAWTAAGFWSAVTGTRLVDAPMLLRPVQGEVIGRVLAVEPDGRGGGRLLIIPTAIDRLTAGALPARVRITVRQGPVPRPGDGVRLRASLSPPSLPVVPGGHDFARSAFFQGLGGIGFAYARPEIVPTPPPSEIFQTIREAVERLRLDLDAVIRAAAPGRGRGGAFRHGHRTERGDRRPDGNGDARQRSCPSDLHLGSAHDDGCGADLRRGPTGHGFSAPASRTAGRGGRSQPWPPCWGLRPILPSAVLPCPPSVPLS